MIESASSIGVFVAAPVIIERMTEPLFLEELEVGRPYGSAEYEVSLEEIVTFASRYDPQPFHLDAEAAERSAFGRLVASGWHTAAIAMRLRVTGDLKLAGGWIGMGIESLKWPKPVIPGDRLRCETEVLEKRESKSNTKRGVIKVRTSLFNQDGELVFETISAQIVDRKSQT